MPRKRVREDNVYQFAELSETAKERARDWWRGLESQDFDAEYILDDAETIAGLMGIQVATKTVKLMGGGTRQKPVFYWSGFSSQGDGACFEGSYSYRKGSVQAVKAHAPKDTELHQIAQDLMETQKRYFYKLSASISHTGHYVHSHSVSISVESDGPSLTDDAEEAIKQALREFMDWIYIQLRNEWEYHMSDEQVDESIIANEYEFTEDGQRT